jgi:SAM-dependent methyltransferase
MSQDWVGSDEAAGLVGSPEPFFAPITIDRTGHTLAIGESTIRRVARGRSLEGNLVSMFLRQAFQEGRVRLSKKPYFRRRENEAARQAYCSLTPAEFDGINARQRWANWRVIPRNLDARLTSAPVAAIDLCCGVGHSTEVLAFYLSPGSRILGLEYNPRFVEAARRRDFRDENGESADVQFREQSVLETFRRPDGEVVPADSIDFVNSSGAVGCHFDGTATAALLDEVARVLRPGGLATIDSGPDGTSPGELIGLAARRGFEPLNRARSCVFDRFEQVCLRKTG